MSLDQLIEPFTWYKYSKKAAARIENPRCAGSFEVAASDARGVRQVTAQDGSKEEGNVLRIDWLVDRDEGVIIDARFTAFGQTALIAAADSACEICVGKNYDQARRITADLIDKQLQDKKDQPAFPKETLPHIQLVIDTLKACGEQCTDLPLAFSYTAPPVPVDKLTMEGEGYPGWMDLPYAQKIAVIEQVLDEEVRPYIALDAGGIHILNLQENIKLTVGYSGSCTSCYSSVGTTLSYVQQVLRAKIHPEVVVIPDV